MVPSKHVSRFAFFDGTTGYLANRCGCYQPLVESSPSLNVRTNHPTDTFGGILLLACIAPQAHSTSMFPFLST
jgi:hypothetical protein